METIESVNRYTPVTILSVLNQSNTGTGEMLEMAKFIEKNHLLVTADEIYSLYETFRQMSSSRIDDGVIDEQYAFFFFFQDLGNFVC